MIKVYSIFDTAVGAYMNPFFQLADGAAIRLFQNTVNNKESQIYRNPDQFILFHIGEFDDKKGEFISVAPRSLGAGLLYKDTISVHIDAEKVFDQLRILQDQINSLKQVG